MNTRLNRHPVRIVAGAAAVLFLSASLPGLAQRQGGQGRGGRGNGGNNANAPAAQAGAFGGFMNTPMGAQIGEMMNKMRQSRGAVDPAVGQTSNLLTRSDVRNELLLNGRQTETIANLQNGYPAAMMQGIMTTVMGSIQKMQQDGTNMDFRTMSADDRQQFITQMRDKAVDSMTSLQSDQNQKSEAVLTPAQTKRLQELDLQWRGPLALSTEKLADKVSLTPDQRTQFTAMLKELRDARLKAQASMFPGMGGLTGATTSLLPPAKPSASGGKGAAPTGKTPPAPATPPNDTPNSPPATGFTPPTPEQMQQAADAANKQNEALLKAMDKKALQLLTPEQQTQWKLMQGKPFTFRQYL